MKRNLLYITVCMALITVLGCSKPANKANKLFQAASKDVQMAQELEKTDYSGAFTKYKSGLEKLSIIVTKYSSTQIAEKLKQNNCEIETITYKELKTLVRQVKIRANAEQNPLVLAYLLAQKITDPEQRAGVLSTIAADFSKEGLMDKSIEAFSKAQQSVTNIDNIDQKIIALAAIGASYAKTGQRIKSNKYFSRAVSLTKSLDNPNLKVKALSSIASSYAKGGYYSNAFEIVKAIQQSFVKSWTISEIAASYSATNQYSQALETAKKIENNDLKAISLSGIAEKFMESGEKEKADKLFSEALELAKSIKKMDQRATTLSEIAINFSKSGQKEKAAQLFDLATDITNGIDNDDVKSRTLYLISNAYAKSGEIQKAEQLFSSAVNLTKKPIFTKGWDIYFHAISQADADQFNEAFKTAGKIKNESIKAKTLSEICIKYAKSGNKDNIQTKTIIHSIINKLSV
ncbi:MAG: tetratricopeptide repeat protein [Candidatus Theseobacter exili]|nr:tetratricopeptide repeat protein [Candidatus Theseobacter exili]